MLPQDQGGVVDANLRVYGLANVRVADASVVPIALSTHLMSSTYGVAEQASNIIRAYYTNTTTSLSTGGSDPGSTASATSTALSAHSPTSTVSTQKAPSGGIQTVSGVSACVAIVLAAAVSIFISF